MKSCHSQWQFDFLLSKQDALSFSCLIALATVLRFLFLFLIHKGRMDKKTFKPNMKKIKLKKEDSDLCWGQWYKGPDDLYMLPDTCSYLKTKWSMGRKTNQMMPVLKFYLQNSALKVKINQYSLKRWPVAVSIWLPSDNNESIYNASSCQESH